MNKTVTQKLESEALQLKTDALEEMVDSLSTLGVYGFSRPFVIKDKWSSCIECLHKKVGIEIEIDWRELVLSVFIVRLESGKLPNGYYRSKDGAPCRYRIEIVIHDHKWNVPKASLEIYPKGKKFDRKEWDCPFSFIMGIFYKYRKLIDLCVDKIISDDYTLF